MSANTQWCLLKDSANTVPCRLLWKNNNVSKESFQLAAVPTVDRPFSCFLLLYEYSDFAGFDIAMN